MSVTIFVQERHSHDFSSFPWTTATHRQKVKKPFHAKRHAVQLLLITCSAVAPHHVQCSPSLASEVLSIQKHLQHSPTKIHAMHLEQWQMQTQTLILWMILARLRFPWNMQTCMRSSYAHHTDVRSIQTQIRILSCAWKLTDHVHFECTKFPKIWNSTVMIKKQYAV